MSGRSNIAIAALAGFLALGAGDRIADTTLVQPLESDSGRVLVQTGRQARVENERGENERILLRRYERLTVLVETRDGWLAAGGRELRDRTEVTLVSHAGGQTRRLRPPLPQERRLRLRPIPLVEDGRLVGLAWLEGDSPGNAAVRVAAWTGAQWEPPVTVAAPGPGSQTGLVGAVLADGAWMLVWSRFDGRDDEIYFSLRRGAGWDKPRRLLPDNAVPDISPTLLAVRGGALLAWSRLDDDDYRLQLARFVAGRWQRPRTVAGPGSLYPLLARREGSDYLLYRDSVVRGWTVLELDAEARILGRASAGNAPAGRPALAAGGADGVTLRFPGARVGAAWEVTP